MIRNKKIKTIWITCLALFILIIFTAGICSAQNQWSVGNNYLLKNNKKTFLHGVNYIPSKEWLLVFEDGKWNEEIIREDFEKMQGIGVNHARVCPLWNLTQPTPEKLYEPVLQRIDKMLDIAEEYNISVQLAPITGWMSGGMFFPDWAVGNIFTDPEILKGQELLANGIAKRYAGSKALLGYDFGNEINVIKSLWRLEASPENIETWMQRIYKQFKLGDSNHPVTNGIGTGFNEHFNIQSIAQNSDYLSVHSYPVFHGTSKVDPMMGQRTTYSPNFIIEWAKMMGKPVLLQEIGCSEGWMNKHAVPNFLELCYLSSWAEGAAGFLWWCSHDIPDGYVPETAGLRTEKSGHIFRTKGTFTEPEFSFGLLDNNNRSKPSAVKFKACSDKVDQLGLDWVDKLPVCYIVVPHDMPFKRAMAEFITPYVLCKQNHFDVKIMRENMPVPADADALVVSGFDLCETGRKNILSYLKKGGKVLQTEYNSLCADIRVLPDTLAVDRSEFYAAAGRGDLFIGQRIVTSGKHKIFKTGLNQGVVKLIKKIDGDLSMKNWIGNTDGILLEAKVGKGTFYYLASDCLKLLDDRYKPWEDDDSNYIFSILKESSILDIDNKYVELYCKVNEQGDKLAIVANHSDVYQIVTLQSEVQLSVSEFFENTEFGKGYSTTIRLAPGKVGLYKIVEL